MALHSIKPLWISAALVLGSTGVSAQVDTPLCAASPAACTSSCGRFDQGDPRMAACENFCRTELVAHCAAAASPPSTAAPEEKPARTFQRKSDVVDERERNGRMIEAIAKGNLRAIRRLIEVDGLDPTYVYAFEFNPQTRIYEGRITRLRLADVFNDVNELRSDDKGLDLILALLIELGMDVKATLATATDATERTAWGPNLKQIERARDRDARMRAFELALQSGLVPNADVDAWLFAELPQICGRDRSQFAIQVVDLLVKYLGTSLQDDFWRAGQRGPETVSDVLDRMMSPGSIPRSNAERAQFADMDKAWENCAPLSHRINRHLTKGE